MCVPGEGPHLSREFHEKYTSTSYSRSLMDGLFLTDPKSCHTVSNAVKKQNLCMSLSIFIKLPEDELAGMLTARPMRQE